MAKADSVWFEFVESKVFSKQIRELSAAVLINIQFDLVQNPQRGDIVKGRMVFGRREWLTRARHEARAVATVICICISNTPAEFICCIYSVKMISLTYHQSKQRSLAH